MFDEREKCENTIKDVMDEIKHSEINGLWKPNYKEGFNDGIAKAVEVIKKYFPDV